MNSKRYNILASSANTVWLTFSGEPHSLIIRSQLLGLGPDHSLLCALPDSEQIKDFVPGILCQGRSLLDGDMYQFETTVRDIMTSPPALLLNEPKSITRQTPRVYPRLPVEYSGTVRPLGEHGRVLAVLPIILNNLCPTGCQLTAPASAWPNISTMRVLLSFQLPNASHSSKFSAKIEWIDPTPELHIGVQFQFSSDKDGGRQDLHRWFSSQQAKIINTTA